MSVAEVIRKKITEDFAPSVLEVENESHRHSGPATESHFKLTVVAEAFIGLSRVKRHQAVYGLLKEQLQNGVHALALHLYEPAEWASIQGPPESPNCRGGSKAESNHN
ncbi:MAG: BolA family transcriptional regulator [Gammaproteobacteria bacterium]|nr:BolA family transcriptional regulator [Gammaproteobacteria bacterium]MCY4355964.1 BolA family transcriptional regulator [Gammaproteobacteria bacterium]